MTPTQLIAAVRAWSAHVITQPNDDMRAKVDAVLAMAEVDAAYGIAENGDMVSRCVFHDAEQARNTALLAAGVEVENG